MSINSQAVGSSWRADPNSELSEQLRGKILAAARVCIADSGPHRLRMGKLAAEAGCSRATLYRYFGSKEEILQSIATQNFQRINAEVDAEIRDIEDVRLKLATGLARSLAIAHAGDASHLFNNEMLSTAMSVPSEGLAAIATGRIRPIFRVAEREGWLRPGVTLEEAVNWVIHASTGLLSMGWPVLGGREFGPDEQVEYLCRFLFFPLFNMEDLLQAMPPSRRP